MNYLFVLCILFSVCVVSVIKCWTCLMDIHHPYAVHNVNKYCTVGTIKRTLKHFLYFECFILHRLAGEEEILSNVLYEFYVLLPLVKAINLAESWRYEAEQYGVEFWKRTNSSKLILLQWSHKDLFVWWNSCLPTIQKVSAFSFAISLMVP